MNNNRNQNNNRRRGRGNRNQGGGGNQGNRIDSRARGNAPQLLDKFKKLAQDAQHNGDRVQAEYYLQFADHYFRVIADNRTRQDEQRGDPRMGRRDERDQDEFDEDEGEAEDRRRFEGREREQPDGRDRNNRERDNRDVRRERPRREMRRDEPADEEAGIVEAVEGPAFDPQDNPFMRDTREEGPRRRPARARRTEVDETGIDAAVLPPSLSANDAGEVVEDSEDTVPRPRRKRSSGGGTLSAVG